MTGEPAGPAGTPAAVEWRRRIEAEYRSAAIAQHVTLWLIQAGAPPDLIRDGLRVVQDELLHSELAADVAAAAAPAQAPPVIDPGTLVLPAPEGPVRALALAVVRYLCIGETVAVPLFRMLRSHATVPIACAALDTVLRDEPRHRRFGWDTLDWLLVAHGMQVLPAVAGALPAMLAEVEIAYSNGSDGDARMAPSVAAWGLAPASAYAEVLVRSLASDVRPRLAARHLTEG